MNSCCSCILSQRQMQMWTPMNTCSSFIFQPWTILSHLAQNQMSRCSCTLLKWSLVYVHLCFVTPIFIFTRTRTLRIYSWAFDFASIYQFKSQSAPFLTLLYPPISCFWRYLISFCFLVLRPILFSCFRIGFSFCLASTIFYSVLVFEAPSTLYYPINLEKNMLYVMNCAYDFGECGINNRVVWRTLETCLAFRDTPLHIDCGYQKLSNFWI